MWIMHREICQEQTWESACLLRKEYCRYITKHQVILKFPLPVRSLNKFDTMYPYFCLCSRLPSGRPCLPQPSTCFVQNLNCVVCVISGWIDHYSYNRNSIFFLILFCFSFNEIKSIVDYTFASGLHAGMRVGTVMLVAASFPESDFNSNI